MKSNELLNQIKTLLNLKVKLEDMKLENGTIVSAESFEKGKEIFIQTDDEKIAMPVGEYMLEDSRILVVEEEGIIGDVREVSDEVPAKEDEEGEEITSDLKEQELAEDDEADVADWKGMEKRIQNLEDAIADLKKDKVEASKKEEEKIEEEIKEELSKPSAKAIKHNPEAKTNEVIQRVYGKGKITTTLDRVLNKLNK
tara:strand:+ start:2906 stop:3499 length:594 start_codon:yes stop_codon:yes gene_type:complete